MQRQGNLLRKLFILFALSTVCLGFLASDFGGNSAQARICCSACHGFPLSPPCLAGCSSSC